MGQPSAQYVNPQWKINNKVRPQTPEPHPHPEPSPAVQDQNGAGGRGGASCLHFARVLLPTRGTGRAHF
eukprot:223576-Prymnesium_polylepis.1